MSIGPNEHHDYEAMYANPTKKFGSPDDLDDGHPWTNKDSGDPGETTPTCIRCAWPAYRPKPFSGEVNGEHVEGSLCTDCLIVQRTNPVQFECDWGGLVGEVPL